MFIAPAIGHEKRLSGASCRIICYSHSPLLAHIYTGLALLHRTGELHLTQCIAPSACRSLGEPSQSHATRDAHLRAILSERITVHFDLHDGHEIDADIADAVDVYYKRSFVRESISDRHACKVIPLGLACPIYPHFVDLFEIRRALGCCTAVGARLKAIASAIGGPIGFYPFGYRLALSHVKQILNRRHQRAVLFITRAWSTSQDRQLDAGRLKERESLNEMRASCIRALKREYGSLFIGGFAPSEHARSHYPDLLCEDSQRSHRGHYALNLHAVPICVSTHGLRYSVPWKIAEYVLFHRAIVSQPLCSEVPSGFAAGKNYLHFTSADQCVDACERLRTDVDLCEHLMLANQQYAFTYLHPDAVVRNSLWEAMARDERTRRGM